MKFRRVCFFLPSAHKDGAELSALECLDALASLGLQCRVVIPQRGPLIAELESRGLPYRLIPYKVWIEPPVPVIKSLLVAFWNLIMTCWAAVLAARWRCDLVVTNTINICVGALVARVLGLPHLWYLREFGYEDHGWRFHLGEKFSLGLMDRLATVCAAVSRAVAQKYRAALPSTPVHYLYQPIQVDLSQPADLVADKSGLQLTCIMVGRLQPGKRQEDAVRALAELRDQGLTVHLWLVGGGDQTYHHFLQTLVRENHLETQVRFWGQVEKALPYIQQADVLLLCSRCEAFARVVIEAMKAGKPVIGAARGGTLEQIQDGFNGFLYEPQNYRDLAAKIKHCHDHPRLTQKMGADAKKWAVKTFNQVNYARELEKILAQLN